MMIIRSKAFPRVGLVGNPSDGYYGKTLSFTFENFAAEVMLYETPELSILPNTRDHSTFSSIEHLVEDVKLYGYYGGIRLLKASVKRFYDYCDENGIQLDDRKFSIRYHSDIPHQVGLAGSSGIITACFRALMSFFGVDIPKPILANYVLSVETQELDISAGLQDRVAQAYQGLVYMDFDKETMEKQGYGDYVKLDTKLLPNLYVAFLTELSEGSEVFHNDIRSRFNRGESDVIEAMRYWANLTEQAKAALEAGRPDELGAILDANFDRRRSIYKISQGNLDMIETARSVGASAKFSGSGGAIVGTYEDDAMFEKLVKALEPLNVQVLKPIISGDES